MIGQALDRRDGPAKVTGRARYAYERQDLGRTAVGYILGSTIATGHITGIDTAAAERAPGVLLVMTHRNAPSQHGRDGSFPDAFGRPWPVLESARITFFNQPVALVVADTFEQARAAALLITVEYAAERGAHVLAANIDRAYAPPTANVGLATDSIIGNLEQAMTEAPVTVDEEYVTSAMFAQPMEPQVCTARWDGDDLHVRASVQIVIGARMALARTLRIAPERVHVDAAFVGGGFGSKLRIHEESIFAALAARLLNRPVRVAQTRRQSFGISGRRPEMIHKVRLAATRNGRLSGVGHDVHMQGSKRERYVEQTATVMRSLYAAPNRSTRHRVINLDVGFGEAVRGPGELPGLLAIESAMDELAVKLEIDPVELRLKNDPEIDPERNVPRPCGKKFSVKERPGVPACRERHGLWRRPNLLLRSGRLGRILKS